MAESLKQMIQHMYPDGPTVVEGYVISDNPLKITLTNDSKIILTEKSLIIPHHLTDYQIGVDLELATGTITAKTKQNEGKHTHDGGAHGGHESGDGSHTHPEGGAHVHNLKTFSLQSGVLKIYNGLKAGDFVEMLSFGNGKQYYVLDRRR